MTTNATRDADRFHIPPADAVKQPVTAMSVIDLKPLFLHFERELQRERDRVAVERTTASSAREALAACEERVRQANAARDLALTELAEARDSYAELLDARDAERDRHVRAHESMTAHRDKLLADCDRHEREAAELRAKLASVAVASPEPGSTAAVVEAVRLLTGFEARVQRQNGTTVAYWCTPCASETANIHKARLALLTVLEELQPAATVRP